MQYEYSCLLFSHHLFAKTASKQIWTSHISDGVSRRPVQQRIVQSEQYQASSAVCLYSLTSPHVLWFNIALIVWWDSCGEAIKTTLIDNEPNLHNRQPIFFQTKAKC